MIVNKVGTGKEKKRKNQKMVDHYRKKTIKGKAYNDFM